MKQKREYKPYQGKRPIRGLKRWLIALLALILAGILAFAALLGIVLAGGHDEIHGDPTVMIILGCQLREDGPSILLQDRLDEALEYLDDHPDMTVVACGGQGADEPESEARAIADYLTENGVSKRNILLDEDSHNTHQNLENAAKLLSEEDLDPAQTQVVVVSNGFHLTRARILAQRCGFEEVSTLAAPESHLPSRLKMYLREPLALVKSFVADR